MQMDMHFYGVYALARAAGINPETAKTIAYASQFVDDAIEDEAIEIEDKRGVVPTMTSHRPIDYQNTIPGDQWKVWVPFHFLPGNDENAKSFLTRMVCCKSSDPASPAGGMLKHALQHKKEPFGAHLAGIAAHVYADTFAHYGFVGLSRNYNRVKSNSIKLHVNKNSIKKYLLAKFETFKTRVAGSFAETVPVGHGAVGTFPDRPYLHWEYEYETGDRVERKNLEDFIAACEQLHSFFCDLVKDNDTHGDPADSQPWNSIADKVRSILQEEGAIEERVELWKKTITNNVLFKSSYDEDKIINYTEKAWSSTRIVYHFAKGGTVDTCNGCLFIRAAWKHRNYVLHELLPSLKVIAY